MTEAILNQPRFQDEESAREHLEGIRWPNGPVCPHCGGTERNSLLKGKATRPGLYFCGDCRSQFTVTVGTVFERSKIPLHKWLAATHLMCASKKGISSKQLERMLCVSYKTAWFMSHRIREAMRQEGGMLGGSGPVEADETYWGNKGKQAKGARGYAHKMAIFAVVERGGKARSTHVAHVTGDKLKPILQSQVLASASVMTDEAGMYKHLGRIFASHETVNHGAKEYARGIVHTNTIESFFAIMKRGLVGTFHHVSEQHLQRYCSEFDFRYNNRSALGVEDCERTDIALKGISGKRLTYRRPDAKQEEQVN